VTQFFWSAGVDHLRTVFKDGMGLTDLDIVTLSGAHTLVMPQLKHNIETCMSEGITQFSSEFREYSQRNHFLGIAQHTPTNMPGWKIKCMVKAVVN
jgi:hypothetical protein